MHLQIVERAKVISIVLHEGSATLIRDKSMTKKNSSERTGYFRNGLAMPMGGKSMTQKKRFTKNKLLSQWLGHADGRQVYDLPRAIPLKFGL